MRAGLVIGLVVLVGCGGEAAEVDGSRSPAPGVTGGEAGAPADSVATGGDDPASGGSLPADPTGGAPAASGGAVATGGATGATGSDTASGGNVAGAGSGFPAVGGEGGAEGPATGGASAAGGGETGGEATGGESSGGTDTAGAGPETGGSSTGGAEPTACTYTCTTTTTDADGMTSASTTRSTYDPCVAGLAESSRCTQTESVAVATVCSIDREPEPIECEPLGGATPDPVGSGEWVVSGSCVRLVFAECQPAAEVESCGGCPVPPYPAYGRYCAWGGTTWDLWACPSSRSNCDGRDENGCETVMATGTQCVDLTAPSTAHPIDGSCVWGDYGLTHEGEPCDDCYDCVPVCVN